MAGFSQCGIMGLQGKSKDHSQELYMPLVLFFFLLGVVCSFMSLGVAVECEWGYLLVALFVISIYSLERFV